MSEITIGLLLPRSSVYSRIGVDITAGLKASLKHYSDKEFRIVTANIGFGADPQDVYEKAEKLLLEEDALAIAGYLDHDTAAILDPLVASMGRSLIVMDPGANVPQWKASANRINISLQAAFGSRLTGRLASEEGVKQQVFATSFHDSGYSSCFSMLKGASHGGGAICFNTVVPLKTSDYNIAPLADAISKVAMDGVLALHCAESGGVFMERFHNAGLHERLRVYASPFALEEEWLGTQPYYPIQMSGFVPWARSLENDENKVFTLSLAKAGGRSNYYSLLGWETGLALSVTANDLQGGTQLAEALGNAGSISSPRGLLRYDKERSFLFGDMVKAELVEMNGKCAIRVSGKAAFESEEFTGFVSEVPGPHAKWKNTYLCI